jgi:hypothetical protein
MYSPFSTISKQYIQAILSFFHKFKWYNSFNLTPIKTQSLNAQSKFCLERAMLRSMQRPTLYIWIRYLWTKLRFRNCIMLNYYIKARDMVETHQYRINHFIPLYNSQTVRLVPFHSNLLVWTQVVNNSK